MLPDCDRAVPAGIELDRSDRASLVTAVMNKGSAGVDEFVRERDGKGAIGEKIKRLRRELEAQLSAVKETREREYAEIKMKAEKLYAARVEKIDERTGDIARAVDSGEVIVSGDILQLIMDKMPAEQENRKISLWQRFKLAVKNFFRKIGNAFVRFYDRLRGRKAPAKKKDEIVLPRIALGGGRMLNMELALDRAMADAEIRKKIDYRINKMNPSDRLRVKLDDRKYREAVKNILQEDIENARKREERERRKRKKSIDEQLEELKKEKERMRQRLESEKKEIEKKKDDEIRSIDRELDMKPKELVRNELIDQFETAGYIRKDEKGLYVTSFLVDRFAEIIYAIEVEGLGTTRKKLISGIGGFGEYQRDNLRTIYESGRMDILDSMLNARFNHPSNRSIYDDDIIVNRELKGDYFHVVIMFDKSGSMDENSRLLAAKKATLALFKAVKTHNKRNVVDLVTFDSKVKVMDLVDVWNCQPEGFTNISEALNVSYGLLARSRADRKLIYLITDGLPEAFTSPDGSVFIGDTGKSMQYAVNSAMRLKSIKDLKLIMIMLEPKQKMYIDAAKEIAAAAEGSVITTDPQDLAKEMLVDYAMSLA